jgi:hypothetical protein
MLTCRNTPAGLLALLMVILAAIACGWNDGQAAAEQAIKRFHAMFNDERYEEIYAALDPRFKEITSEQEMFEILQAVHIKLGKVTATTMTGGKASSYLTETQIVILQDTEFERGKGIETFTFFYADKKASLAGYNINSKDLILK